MDSAVVDAIVKFLPIIAPVLLQGLKAVAPKIMEKTPWYAKALMSAVISGIIATLTQTDVVSGAAIGTSASIAYAMKGARVKSEA